MTKLQGIVTDYGDEGRGCERGGHRFALLRRNGRDNAANRRSNGDIAEVDFDNVPENSGESMHIAEADETRLLALVRDAAELAYEGRYVGVSWRDLERYDRYAEPGFSLIKEDKHLTQLQHLPPP